MCVCTRVKERERVTDRQADTHSDRQTDRETIVKTILDNRVVVVSGDTGCGKFIFPFK